MIAPSPSITELVAHAAKLGATFRLAGEAVSVACTEALPPPLYTALKERRDELWHLLGGDTSDRQPLDLLSRLDVAPVIPTTWEKACAALAEIEADSDRHTPAELSGRPGLLGLDIETAALPGAEQRPLLKLRKDGLPAKHQPKLKGGAGLDPHRSRIRLVQLYGGGDRCLVLDTDLVSIDVLRPVLQRRTMVIHNAGFELRYFAAAGLPSAVFRGHDAGGRAAARGQSALAGRCRLCVSRDRAAEGAADLGLVGARSSATGSWLTPHSTPSSPSACG